MRRHGGKPRKNGARYPGGQLRYDTIDRGHEMTHEHRAELVGLKHAGDPLSSCALGRMVLRGQLADRGTSPESDEGQAQTRRRLAAGIREETMRLEIFGAASAPSHMRNIQGHLPPAPLNEDDPTRAARLAARDRLYGAICASQMQTPPAPGGRLLTHQAVERVITYDMDPDEQDLETVRRGLDVAARLLGLDRDRRDDRPKRPTHHPAHPAPKMLRRTRGLEVLFDRARDGPDSQAVIRALDKLRAGIRPAGSAETLPPVTR